MIRYERRLRRLAHCLAFLAGFVDAIGFLKSGGLFVSFMSGNSTRMAIGVAETARAGLSAAGLIALFVLGVMISAMIAARVTVMHRKVTVMSCVATILLAAAILQSGDQHVPALGMLCLAMGAANSMFQRNGEVVIGVTYMTGTLVKLGHRLADAALGGNRTAWTPYFLLWLALVSGGAVGATAHAWFPTGSLWMAAGFAGALVPVTLRLTRPGS